MSDEQRAGVARSIELDLAFERRAARTVATRAFAQPPLQLSRVRYDDPAHPGHAAITLLHQAGVLQGDHYGLTITAGATTQATVVTAAATQVYRAPEHGAEQRIALRVEEEACLHFLPEPIILCADADYRQETSVCLAPSAHLILLDVVVPGRLQRGEVWRFRRFRSQLTVVSPDGSLLMAEQSKLQPDEPGWWGTGMATAPVVGTAYLLGPRYLSLLPVLRRRITDPLGGADRLPNDVGLIIRLLGSSGSSVRRTLVSWLQL